MYSRIEQDPGSDDRYPAIFLDLKDLLSGEKDPDGSPDMHRASLKLLSFGCGSGEPRTMRKYFPEAHVDGVDADRSLIASNNGNNSDKMLRYHESTSSLQPGSYDAVLALSVLCSPNEKSFLPYESFVNSMTLIDQFVKPGGYIVLYNSNYPFYEFAESHRYESVADRCNVANENVVEKLDQRGSVSPHSWNRGWCTQFGKYCTESGWRSKYDRTGKQIQPKQPDDAMTFGCFYPGTMFRKVSAAPTVVVSKKPVELDAASSFQPLELTAGESTAHATPVKKLGGKLTASHKLKGKFTKAATHRGNTADTSKDEPASIVPAGSPKQMVTVIYHNMD
jgi:hypothetical protein